MRCSVSWWRRTLWCAQAELARARKHEEAAPAEQAADPGASARLAALERKVVQLRAAAGGPGQGPLSSPCAPVLRISAHLCADSNSMSCTRTPSFPGSVPLLRACLGGISPTHVLCLRCTFSRDSGRLPAALQLSLPPSMKCSCALQ